MTITINPTMITANVVGIFPLVVQVIGGAGIKGDTGATILNWMELR